MGKNKYCYENGNVYVFLSNTDDAMLLNYDKWANMRKITWFKNSNGYAQGKYKGKKLTAHRVVMDCPPELTVDHINWKKLDNRDINLRNCTMQENNKNRPLQKNNTSGVKGIYYIKRTDKWKAEIWHDCEYEYLGLFGTREDAIKARREAEIKYFGEFA